MTTIKKIVSLVALLAIFILVGLGINNAKAFVPIPLDGKHIAFGGVIQRVSFCECPIPGVLLHVSAEIGGIGGQGGFGGPVFYRPGSSVTVFGGQFLRVSPFVIGTVKTTSYLCGEIKVDKSGPFCNFFGAGLQLVSIGAFP